MRLMRAFGSKLCPACFISSYISRASDNWPCDARALTSTLLISFKILNGMHGSKTTCAMKD